MKPLRLSIAAAAVFVGSLAAYAGSPMQTQGEEALAKKDYATALPLLQQAAEFEKANKEAWTALRAKIADCKTHLTPEQFEKLSWSVGAPPPAAATQAVPARTPHEAPKAGETRTLGIKELGNFEYDPETGGLPADVLKLNGMKVNMWGFMIPTLQADAVTEFLLVPSLTGCCYGQPPGVQHQIVIHCGNTPMQITTQPIRVIGTLHVEEKRESNYTLQLFEITPDKIETVNVDVPGNVLQGKGKIDMGIGGGK